MKKKITGILAALTAFMLLPFSAFANAPFETGDRSTFWGALYLDGATDDTFVRPVNIRFNDYLEKGATALAKEVATKVKELPKGRRMIDLTGFTKALSEDVENHFFLADASKDKLEAAVDSFFSAYKSAGGEIDYVIDDNESSLLCYSVENKAISHFRKDGESIEQTIQNNGALYEEWIKKELIEIEKTSKYQDELRPMLEAADYTFGDDYDLKYINIFPGAQEPRKTRFYESNPPEGAERAYQVFNEVVKEDVFKVAYNEVVYEPIKKYYPDVKFSNYGYVAGTVELPVYDYQGNDSKGRKRNLVGTHIAPVMYGMFSAIAQYPPKEYPFKTMEDTAYNQLLLQLIKLCDACRGKGDAGLMPWVGLKSWVSNTYKNYYNTDYYTEGLLHFGLYNPDPFLIYNTGATTYGDDIELLRKLFHQLGDLVGFDDRKPILPTISQAPTWDQRYLLTGMEAGGKAVWRITPDLYTPGVSMENFKLKSSDVSFRIGNQCIDFPAGSYIYEPKEKVSEYGYWVISPKGTRPVEYRAYDLPLPDAPVNTEDHKPTGYLYKSSNTMPNAENIKPIPSDDNTTKEPSAPITDSVKLKLNPIMGNGAKTALFSGVMPSDIEGHWAKDSLANMLAIGVMKGSDIGMEPEKLINKAEFLTMLMRMLGVKTIEYTGGFADIAEGAWYADVMYTAVSGGWITPVAESYLYPESDLTRANMCVILSRALELNTEGMNDLRFNDSNLLSGETLGGVNGVAALGLLEGYPDGSFYPNNICTRAETAVVFERLLNCIPKLFEGER